MRWSRDIKDLFFPRGIYCIVCGKYIDNTRKYALCDDCIKRMNFSYTEFGHTEADLKYREHGRCFDYGFSAMGYGMYERRLIFNLKYNGKTYIAPILADIIYDAIYSKISEAGSSPLFDGELIVPVPIHKNRLHERGFNQAEKVSKYLAQKLAIPVDPKVLIRGKETSAQRALSAKERKLNMEGVFRVPEYKKKDIQDKTIIVFDDILTTGATVEACAKCLKEQGAKKIYVLTLLFAGNRHHLMIE